MSQFRMLKSKIKVSAEPLSMEGARKLSVPEFSPNFWWFTGNLW